ncbi:MAG: dicarboxylate/amino acid:cation symporter [Bacteroidales bacterium]|nr:dicarboxylate/amino acid:cation symporter [Bacteroidales bacterium]
MKRISRLYRKYRALSLGTRIMIFMGIGTIAGVIFGEDAVAVQPIGDLFIKLLMLAAIPLVFFNLLNGLAGLSDIKSLGRITVKIGLFYAGTSTLSFVLGYFTMNTLEPGKGFNLNSAPPEDIGEMPNVIDMLLDMIPDNVFKSFAEANMVQIVIFAVLLGITILTLPKDIKRPIVKGLEVLSRLFRELVSLVLEVSPLGIGALMAATFGVYGSKMFGPLAFFLGGVWGTQLVMMGVFLILLFLFTRMTPGKFFNRTGTLYATAVATCSSWACLAVGLELAEKKLHLPKHIYSFTLPLGIQLNKNGTAIMLIGVLLFTAQASGITFDPASVVTIILIGLLLETGSGGIPGGGLVIALIFVKAFNLPLEIAAIVGGIYRLVDMGNTTINVMGDMVGTIIVSNSEEKRLQRKSIKESE